MRRLLLVVSVVGLLAACSTTAEDYQDQTEDYLNEDGQVEDSVGGDVTNAACEEPLDTEIGTRYTCIAEVEGLGTYSFDAEIDGESSFVVIDWSPA